MTRYLVERKPNDSSPILCDTEQEAINTANEVNGTAWRKVTRYSKNGCPITSWARYIGRTWECR